MLVVSDLGVFSAMEILRQTWNSALLRLHLFQNNIIPARTNVLADFTEATFDGYAPVSISTWAVSVVSGHIAVSTPNNAIFTKSAGPTSNSVYGYYVTNSANTQLLWSERDPAAPFLLSVAGTQYSVQLSQNYQNLAGVP